MSNPASFSWIGATSGDWNTPTNWADVTTGQTPAVVVPGSLDIVTIANGTVTGGGDSASLAFLGTDTVLGELNTGTMAVGSASASVTLDIDAGATISAITATDAGTISTSGSSAALITSGQLQLGFSSNAGILSATDGALVQASNLVFSTEAFSQITVDGSSTIEIGNLGGATTGALTIDSGQRLSGPGSVFGNLIVNGAVSSDELILGHPVAYSGGEGPSSFQGTEFTSVLSGTGTVNVEANGTISLQEPVTASGLTLRLGGSANLIIGGSIAAGNTIDLSGNSNTLTIDDQWYLVEHPAQQVGQSPFYTGGPPPVDATINDFSTSDALAFIDDPLLGTTITAAFYAGGVLTLLDGTVGVSAFNLVGDYDGKSFIVGAPNNSQQIITVACFAAGTAILTASGERAVENLQVGDLVLVQRGGQRFQEKVRWIGHRAITLTSHPRPDLAAPICIRRHAVGPAQPNRDLRVSPDHCLFIEDKLIPALMLVNDMTIVQERSQGSVVYFHVELDRHGILLAEGLPTESYLDTGNRATFADAGLAMLHPDFQVNGSLRTWREDACAPLTVDPATLEPIWRRLADRGRQLGFRPRQITTDDDPKLHALVAGQVITPISRVGDIYTFVLPRGSESVVLKSRATRPADVVRYLDDRRLLGVAIRYVSLGYRDEWNLFWADHLPAGSGWHDHESAGEALWRWTDGAGELLFDPFPSGAIMELKLSGSNSYIIEEVPSRVAA